MFEEKEYVINVQTLPYKETVEFSSFGFRDDNVKAYSDLYNLIYSVFYW